MKPQGRDNYITLSHNDFLEGFEAGKDYANHVSIISSDIAFLRVMLHHEKCYDQMNGANPKTLERIQKNLEGQHLQVNEHYCHARTCLKEAEGRRVKKIKHRINVLNRIMAKYDKLHDEYSYCLECAIKHRQEAGVQR